MDGQALVGVVDSDEPDVDESLPDRRPRAVETKPKTGARNKLNGILVDEFGFDVDSAVAIVRAIEDPDQAIIQLKAPAEIGVHGGTLRIITVRLRNGTAMPIPTNPRVSSRISFPAGGAGPSGGMEPLTMSQRAGSTATIEINTASVASLTHAMQVARDYIVNSNDLRESVRSQGVLLPVTLIPVTFAFSNSEPDRTVVCTIDGSSRLTAAMEAWDLTAEEVLFKLGNERLLADKRQPVLDLMGHDVATLSANQLSRLRTQSLPANLIVGYEAFEGGLLYPAILDAYLGLLHVEPPQPWGDAAGYDKRADAVLDELERLGRINESRKKYLAGLMSPGEAETAGFDSSLDGRAAQIFYDLDRTRNARAVNRALRRIGMRAPLRGDRLEVATELAMRPYRRAVNELVRRNPRVALPSAMQRLRPEHWTPTTLTPEQLREDALAELREQLDGPACQELAVRAAFWLTRYNALQKSSRTDTRFADELLENIRQTEHGLRVLAQAILSARAGGPPQQVREEGSVAAAPDGKLLFVDDQWLRRTFPMPDAVESEAVGTDAEEEPTWEPQDELRSRIYAIRDDSETLAAKVESLKEVEDEGRALIETEGVPSSTADEIAQRLDDSRLRIHVLKAVWQARNDSGSTS